jgi:hypothetical protein
MEAEMRKKMIALTTSVFYIIFSCSCSIYTWKKTSIDSLDAEKREGRKIYRAQIRTGEQIEFSRRPATRIRGDFIVGEKFVGQIEIKKKDIISIKPVPNHERSYFPEGQDAQLITTTNGLTYRAISIRESKDIIICDVYVSISLPLSDVTSVWLKRVNVAGIIGNVLIVAALVGIVALAIAMSGIVILAGGVAG